MTTKETIIAKDRYGTAAKIIRYSYDNEKEEYVDFTSDGRMILTPVLARRLAKKLLQFAEQEDALVAMAKEDK